LFEKLFILDLVNSTGLSQGVQTVTYANAYDGSDLEVHLMFHEIVITSEIVDTTGEEDDDKGGFGSMQILLSAAAFVVIGIVSFLTLKKKSTREVLDMPVNNQPPLIEATVLNEWTDETGHTWRKMSDGSGRWWNGTSWQEV
jgi:hypothetical protein